MTEAQGTQLLTKMGELNSLMEGVGIVTGAVALVCGCAVVLLAAVLFAKVSLR